MPFDDEFPVFDIEDVLCMLYGQSRLLARAGFPDVGAALLVIAKFTDEGILDELLPLLEAISAAQLAREVEAN